jgi:uncharacterized protein (TIGR02646 family)
MRTISGGIEPNSFTQWKLGTPGLGYSNVTPHLRDVLLSELLHEQRGLCAYTGLRVDSETSHVEHLTPQVYCTNGQDIQYSNMVACWPRPRVGCKFGARRKDCWPTPVQNHLFVSPRSNNCESRFDFDLHGNISASNPQDQAAAETIIRLALDCSDLIARRKHAIYSTLEIRGAGPSSLKLRLAKKRLRDLEAAEGGHGQLEPFCFALKQALRKHIQRVEAIRYQRNS